jgi:hypothetical protein
MKLPRQDGWAVEVLINGDVLFMFLLLLVFPLGVIEDELARGRADG